MTESGYEQNGSEEAFIFAGFVGPLREWEAFAHGWAQRLNKRRVLSAQGFKTHLRRTPNSKRIGGFVRVIKKCGKLYRVSVTIPNTAYKTAVLDQIPKWRKRGLRAELLRIIDNPYYFGFYAIMMQVLLPMVWLLAENAQLEVIYDENIQEAEKLKASYKDFLATNPEAKQLRREPRGETDDQFMPLLAADLLAWHMHRDFVERQLGREYQDTVWTALNELPTCPPLVLNEADLSKIAAWDKFEEMLS